MKKILLLLCSVLLTAACDEDQVKKAVTVPQTAQGEWHLVKVSGSIAGITDIYEPGTITWTFNNNGTVTVVNTNTDETKTDFFDSGNYTCGFVPNEEAPDMCESVLKVNNIEFGCQNISGNTLTLTNTWADGYQLTFTH